jgi:hypothetical protein
MDSGKRDPWKLCTVTQVEEIKSILRLLPIWHCTILYSVVFTQMASMFVVQGRRNAPHDAHHRPHADRAVRVGFIINSNLSLILKKKSSESTDSNAKPQLCPCVHVARNYFSNVIVSTVTKVTTTGGRPGWIPTDLN